MSITLSELVGTPHLGLTVLAGEPFLNKAVTWAHVSEMEDPTPFLEGGELLMAVGLAFPPGPDAQVAYIERLVNRGVVAVAFADRAALQLSSAFLGRAEELGCPVLSVKWEVPFFELARIVATANEHESQLRVMTHVQIFDLLRTRVVDGASAPELLRRIGELTGYELYLATPEHEELVEDVPTPPADVVASLPNPVAQPVSIDSAHALPVIVRGALVGYVVAAERTGARRPAGLIALQHIETVVAIEVERIRSRAELRKAYRARLLEEMLAGDLTPRGISRRLADEGLEAAKELVLVALRARDQPDHERPLQTLSDSLRQRSVPHLMTFTDPAFLLTADGSHPVAELAGIARLQAGVSRPCKALEGLDAARRDALMALEIARSRDVTLVRAGVDVNYLLALTADRVSLERMINAALGPVIRYDAQHHTDLMASLRCYLEHGRSVRKAAKHLFVHPNSLSYRLRRIEGLTGRQLGEIDVQTEFWMALEAHRLMGGKGQQ